jgi:hypothetical protein
LDDIRSTLEDFLDEFSRAVDGDTQTMERVLNGDATLTTSDLGSTPESWTEDALITPLLDAAGLNKVPGRPSSQRETPDFRLEQEGAGEIVGENKASNRIEVAEEELVGDYISKKSWSDYGIATDGFQWVVYRAERGGDFTEYNEVRHVDLRPALRNIARQRGYIGQQPITDTDADSALQAFADTFTPDKLVPILTEEAPRLFRNQRQKQVDEFYELYIELIFGVSDEYDGEYETCLREDIIAPDQNTPKQNDVFAITLVNRLLFIKFLETRGVIPEGFLQDRVDDYNEDVPGTLYKTIIEPLFYDLFNTPKEDRRADHRHGWFTDVPYLNGGLFRENVAKERDYDILDRTLPTLITDLIEGTELDLDLDPAILGSVFEKTINHLSESENRQQEMGAFYTPNDVTRLVNEEAVDRKIREEIIEAYTDELSHPDEFRAEVEDMALDEMLSRIEDGAGWFGNNAAMTAARNRIIDLKMIDPACGSGHFLTAAMEEMNQVLNSLHRGLHGGTDPSAKEQYEMKKQLALQAIYGVDIDRVATEIAKLRTWLKIVEDNGWDDDFSQLPNIDINIIPGNSLVGLPAKSSGQFTLTAFDIDLEDIEDIRQQYKDEEIGRSELNTRIEELRPELRDQYINRLNHYVEQRIEDPEVWNATVESLDSLYPEFRKITVRREDGEPFSDSMQTRLDSEGFRVESRYGKSAKVEDEGIDKVDPDELAALLDRQCVLEVERQPMHLDLRQIEEVEELSSGIFHWIVEFPEAVADDDGNGYSVEFDIVVGNPPYGDVLSDAEKRVIGGYKTGSVTDIVAQFIEREFQLLDEGGYFGNIVTLRFIYQTRATEVRDVVRSKLTDTRIACFARRPSQVFEGAQPRAGVVTGQREDTEQEWMMTSRFLRFNEESREEAFRNIQYASTVGLNLGDKIGSDEDYSIPKIGDETTRSILEKLKEDSDTVFADKMSRSSEDETSHVVWRREGISYFIHPLLENLFPEGDKPREVKPMYFDSGLDRKTAFLLLQSSTYYAFWMVYGNERHLPWKLIDAFPFPDDEKLEEHREEITELADRMWSEMAMRFKGGIRETIEDAEELKPLMDEADELLGPLFGLSEEEIEFVKGYDAEFGRAAAASTTLDDFDLEEALEVIDE